MNRNLRVNRSRWWGAAALAASAAVLQACGGGGSDDAAGTVRFALTDAPACYDAVNVTVQKVRIHKSGAAAEGDSGWSEVVLATPKRVNLVPLTNGVLEELGQATVPAGNYSQIHLVLAPNDAATPLANSVQPIGGTEVPLDTPSAMQSGLKLQTHFEVEEGEVADFVLDFDACKSIVTRGNSGQYALKPVVAVLPRVSAAGLKVEGHVVPALGIGSTSVSLQSNGVVARATVPDATGKFILSPVPEGTYDLVVAADGRVTAVMTGVPVAAASVTTVNPASAAIDPAASTMRVASGAASTTGSAAIPDATLRVLQSLTGGPTIELGARPVDAVTGGYSFSVPLGAPVKTAYAAGATTLTFSADAAAAGKYTLEASVPGKPTQTTAIDVTAADVVTPFAFAP
ncbi:MAG TPA: DUF4382 domain-containing protein [Albitalea sp.]